MGAWGDGSFQNDSALDWLGDLCDGGSALPIREILTRVVEHGGTKRPQPSLLRKLLFLRPRTDWLTADVSSAALAAAEIVAAWLGRPSAELPENAISWLEQHSGSLSADLVPIAKKAVFIVKTNSELKDLWEEGDATEWMAGVVDLEKRLG